MMTISDGVRKTELSGYFLQTHILHFSM